MFWSMFVYACVFVCVNMQMQQKESQQLSGWDDGGGVGVETNTLCCFPGMGSTACRKQHPFGVGAKCFLPVQ